MRLVMSQEDREVLRKMLYDYGNEGVLRVLIVAIRDQADEQSDMGMKEEAKESSELADILLKVRSNLQVGRHKMANSNDQSSF